MKTFPRLIKSFTLKETHIGPALSTIFYTNKQTVEILPLSFKDGLWSKKTDGHKNSWCFIGFDRDIDILAVESWNVFITFQADIQTYRKNTVVPHLIWISYLESVKILTTAFLISSGLAVDSWKLLITADISLISSTLPVFTATLKQ